MYHGVSPVLPEIVSDEAKQTPVAGLGVAQNGFYLSINGKSWEAQEMYSNFFFPVSLDV